MLVLAKSIVPRVLELTTMGQGYSAVVQEGDTYFDSGQLDEAETRYLSLIGQKEPANGSDDTLLNYGRAKLHANMNLGLIHMCRGQFSQAEKYMSEAAQLEVRHSDSQRQHHVNTLALFYWAATSCLHPKMEAEVVIQRIATTPFVTRALEARLEHATLVACARAWLLFLLDRPLPVILAPLERVEPLTSRITYNTEESITPTINFEVDGELEGVDVDLDDDEIGDVPSDDDLDLDDDPPKNSTPKKAAPSSSSNGSAPAMSATPNYLEFKSKRANPSLQLVKAIALTVDPTVDMVLIQALAQAARALGMEHARSFYAGEMPKLYAKWKARGEALQRKERHRASLVPFIIALASNWTSLEAWVSMARAFGEAGELDTARKYLSIVTDVMAPNDALGWIERSMICMKSGKFAEAAMCCDRVTLDIDPKNVDAWERRAFATLQLRRWSSRAIVEALEHTDAALALDPTHAGALRTQAFALIVKGAFSDALVALDDLLKQHPDDAEGIHAKSVALRHTRAYDDAIVWAKKAAAANPQSADVALHLALCYLELATSKSPEVGVAHLSDPDSPNHNHTEASSRETKVETSDTSSSASVRASIDSNAKYSHSDSGRESPSVNSSRVTHNMASCDPSLMPNGTFVGSLPFNQADDATHPTMLTLMAHLHNTPNVHAITNGLDATENALDVATRYPDRDGPSHFYFEPSALPRTKHEHYADESGQLVKIQNQFVKSQIWATRAILLAHARRHSEAITAADHAIEESPAYPVLALIAKGDVMQLSKSGSNGHIPLTPELSRANGAPVDSSQAAAEAHTQYSKALEFDANSEPAILSVIHLLLSNNASKEVLKYTTKLVKLATDGGALQRPKLAIEVHASTLFHLAQYDAAYRFCLEHILNKKEDINGTNSPRKKKDGSTSDRPFTPAASDEAHSSDNISSSSSSSSSLSNNQANADDEEDAYQVRLLNIAAHSLHQLGKCEEAQSFFDKALRPDPMNVYTWNEKARCLLQNRRFDDALNYFDRALVLDPANLRTILNRSLCQCLLGNLEEGADTILRIEKGEQAEQASQWLQSLSPTERAYHFDSLAAARESKKRKDRESQAATNTDDLSEEM